MTAQAPDPSEEEIQQRLKEIRRQWSKATREKRTTTERTEWTVPETGHIGKNGRGPKLED